MKSRLKGATLKAQVIAGTSREKAFRCAMFWYKHLFSKRDFPVTGADFSGASGAFGEPPPLPSQGAGEARVADLEAKLEAATAEAEKLREEWLRAKAETDNVRRRGQEDVAKAHRFGLEGFAGALLAVKDSPDAAVTVGNTSIESFKEGVELTARQLDSLFEKVAIRGVNTADEEVREHTH